MPRRRKPGNETQRAPGGSAVRAAPRGVGSAQTAWIGDPAAPPTQAGAAENGVRAGRDGPDRDCNHIDLPLGTGPIDNGRAGLPKRTRYVVA